MLHLQLYEIDILLIIVVKNKSVYFYTNWGPLRGVLLSSKIRSVHPQSVFYLWRPSMPDAICFLLLFNPPPSPWIFSLWVIFFGLFILSFILLLWQYQRQYHNHRDTMLIRIINVSYCKKQIATFSGLSLFLVLQNSIFLPSKQRLRRPSSFYLVVASSFRSSESFIFSRVAWEREREWKSSWDMLWSELQVHWPEISHMTEYKRSQEICWTVHHERVYLGKHQEPIPLNSFHNHTISSDQPLSGACFMHTLLTIQATLLPSLSYLSGTIILTHP